MCRSKLQYISNKNYTKHTILQTEIEKATSIEQNVL